MADLVSLGLPPRNAEVVWYPGSGLDVGPCITDIEKNPLGTHLRRPNGNGTLWLWMSDYNHDVIAGIGSDAPPVYGFEDEGAMVRMRVAKVQCRVKSRLRIPKVDPARNHTRQVAPFPTFHQPDWDVALLEVTVIRMLRGGRDQREDVYSALFSPFDSESMVQHVFKPLGVRLSSLVLLRLRGIFTSAAGAGPSQSDVCGNGPARGRKPWRSGSGQGRWGIALVDSSIRRHRSFTGRLESPRDRAVDPS